VTPTSGPKGTEFKFGITYTDANDDVPSFIRVKIGVDQYSLTPEDGVPDTITTGEIYTVSGLVLDEGSHQYHFETSDGDDQVRFPSSGELDGPEVQHVNSAPRLQNNQLYPITGYSSDDYTFKVVYSDEEDQPPSGGVSLLLNDGYRTETMMLDTTASPHLRDSVFTNGEAYSISISLPVGTYTHSFNASDGDLYAELGPFNGPFIDDDPIIKVTIDSPAEAQVFKDDENITFESSYSSNVAITDAQVVWTSNISGIIGSSEDIIRMLEHGHHCIIVNISSQTYDISDETMVNITVIHDEPPVQHPIILHISPSSNFSINEGNEIRIEVEVNYEHPDVQGAEGYSFEWFFDGEKFGSTSNFTILKLSYLEAGLHEVVLNLTVGYGPRLGLRWNITVIDIPAPIDLTGELPSDIGSFEPGDEITVDLPLKDKESRILSAVWTVDDLVLDETNISLSLLLGGGAWAHEGNHSLKAVVTNPDGTEVVVIMNYTIIYPDIGDDDDDVIDDDEEPVRGSGDKKEKIGLGGLIIIVIGSTALLVGIVYGIYAIVAPVQKREKKQDEEVMDWDYPDESEHELRSGPIKEPLFSKLPPPPRFPGGGS
jgi:hypothetical protein